MLISLDIMLLVQWQGLKMHVYVFLSVFCKLLNHYSCSIITYNQPIFTGNVAMCKMHDMHFIGAMQQNSYYICEKTTIAMIRG